MATTPIKYRISSVATKPTTDSVKGAPLTSLEIDGNFRSIKDSIDAEGARLDASIATQADRIDDIILNGIGSILARHSATATAGQTVFDLPFTYSPGANNLVVFVNGLLVERGTDYTETSGTRVTFNTGLEAGQEATFLTNVSPAPAAPLYSVAGITSYTLVSNGVLTSFALPVAVLNKDNTQVYVNGIYQEKSSYSIAGSTLVFSEAPVAGNVEVVVQSSLAIGEALANSVSYAPAGTGAVPTTVQNKLRETVSVKDFGAVGDGVTDDTVAIQAAINSVGIGVVIFPEGRTYRASNISLPARVTLKGEGGATIKALNTGNSAYLVATASYASNAVSSADAYCQIDSLVINANGYKTAALAWRGYYGRVTKSKILGATAYDVLVTTLGVDGAAAPTGSMVNNKWIDNWIGGADDFGLPQPQYNFYIVDASANKVTDMMFIGNYVSWASVRNAQFSTAAGLICTNNHFYGGSVEFLKGFMGFVCSNNYFENDVVINDITAGVTTVTFGPGNTLLDALKAKFGPNGNKIISKGNKYFGDSSSIRHCYNDVSKTLVSLGDDFDAADPMGFYNLDGTTPAASSSGIFQAVSCYLSSSGRTWNNRFSGTGKTYASQPSVYTSSAFAANNATATSALNLSLSFPALKGDDAPAEIEFNINTRRNYSSTIAVSYFGKGTLTKKWDNTYHFTMNNVVYTAGQWTSAPAFSATESSGVVTVTVTGTWNGDGVNYFYGGAILKATV